MRPPPTATDATDATDATNATAPGVVIAPDAKGVVERFVVGVDGSAQSVEALRWAARIAAGSGARVDVVMTWEARVGMAGPFIAAPGGTSVGPEDDAQRVLERTVDAVYGRDRPPDVSLLTRHGEAAHILIEESRTAQLLVIGSRGLSQVVGLLLGSVSTRCAERAHCPVLIMHEPEQP